MCHEGTEGSRVIALLCPKSASDGGGWSAMHSSHCTLGKSAVPTAVAGWTAGPV